jgi:hypothetical protein
VVACLKNSQFPDLIGGNMSRSNGKVPKLGSKLDFGDESPMDLGLFRLILPSTKVPLCLAL